MSEKFPYGYDLNAYIDKAFEQMKADFPWATRDMMGERTCFGIDKVGGEYQYVRYYSNFDGTYSPDPLNVDSEEFIRRLAEGHDWELERANPVKECIDVEASDRCSGDWFLECYQIRKHEKGGYSVYVTAGNRSAGGSKTVFIPASYFKLSWEEFLDKYLGLATPGSFYVGKADLERDPRIKEFLGF